jgi:RNA polymerase sigma factor (sigma-70 family)
MTGDQSPVDWQGAARLPLRVMDAGNGGSSASGGVVPRFEACFQANYGRVLAYALRRTGDRATAEDVAAETFLVAWRRQELLPSDELPWLLGVARNLLLNELRTSRRRERLAARVAAESAAFTGPTDAASLRDPGCGPRANTGADRAAEPVLDALASLGERDREVLLLATWDGLDQRRAAVVLGCSPATFAVRLHRARKRLAKALNLSNDRELP